jgi:two-component system nitrogen regulation response regulator NtrX
MATILCIDNDPRILEFHRAVLTGGSYMVLTALDGPSGIALTRNHSIDAIVLDFNMAGMDGSAMAQALMKEHPTVPVVVCSGCLDDIPESLKWFADALLEKTDGPEALISTIVKLTNTSISSSGKGVSGVDRAVCHADCKEVHHDRDIQMARSLQIRAA